ncbi:MAG: acyl-CoA dehydrogenase family protein [Nitrospinota bacterium]|jgi:alkylation response protein AidB-like acyl-CoA dehydrogenase|nr:acyl-CoA dehydrogenase family protein [Nitrospinota bacterium]MDP6619381.1 acyl-CoA dehydrogenase family protein [Nitrospinota bacterium]HJM42601.1 acyl-CoA dehydrogenase family protein [Nitrospinota bacterium]
MDLDLNEEQRSLQALCREFARREILPHRDEWNTSGRFPLEVFRKMADLGLMGLLVPEAYGGAGVGAVAYVAAMEEMAKADQSVAATWNAHLTIGSLPLLYFGTEEQKRRWLGPLARGERLGAFGLTEPEAGSDARAIRTAARREGNAWVINGTKMFTSNAGTEISLGVILLAVSGEKSDGSKEYSAFMVPRDTPGFRLGRSIPKIGWHAVDTRELVFENCRVPSDHLIGERGVGLRQFMQALAVGRISVAALSLGLAQACLEVSLEYAKQREQFGQPIGRFQAIQFKLADMAVAVENARLITYKAAWLHDRGADYAKEAAMAKLYASDTAMQAALEAVQIHGGYGYTDEFVVSRFFRDAKILQIGEGTNEIQRLVIARHLGC